MMLVPGDVVRIISSSMQCLDIYIYIYICLFLFQYVFTHVFAMCAAMPPPTMKAASTRIQTIGPAISGWRRSVLECIGVMAGWHRAKTYPDNHWIGLLYLWAFHQGVRLNPFRMLNWEGASG